MEPWRKLNVHMRRMLQHFKWCMLFNFLEIVRCVLHGSFWQELLGRTSPNKIPWRIRRSVDNFGTEAIRKTWPSVSWRKNAVRCCTCQVNLLSYLVIIGTQFSIHILWQDSIYKYISVIISNPMSYPIYIFACCVMRFVDGANWHDLDAASIAEKCLLCEVQREEAHLIWYIYIYIYTCIYIYLCLYIYTHFIHRFICNLGTTGEWLAGHSPALPAGVAKGIRHRRAFGLDHAWRLKQPCFFESHTATCFVSWSISNLRHI